MRTVIVKNTQNEDRTGVQLSPWLPVETYRIVLRYACYAIEIRDGAIVDAAPIAKWAIGKKLNWFKGWVEKKGGTVKLLHPKPIG